MCFRRRGLSVFYGIMLSGLGSNRGVIGLLSGKYPSVFDTLLFLLKFWILFFLFISVRLPLTSLCRRNTRNASFRPLRWMLVIAPPKPFEGSRGAIFLAIITFSYRLLFCRLFPWLVYIPSLKHPRGRGFVSVGFWIGLVFGHIVRNVTSGGISFDSNLFTSPSPLYFQLFLPYVTISPVSILSDISFFLLVLFSPVQVWYICFLLVCSDLGICLEYLIGNILGLGT
ncbi:hypothetical protein V8F20_000363 [Naviculisporaceae sp. PSN 640]